VPAFHGSAGGTSPGTRTRGIPFRARTGGPVGAVILAAGLGRRMGGHPKALLELEGMTFLERVAGACREGGCTTLWAVTNPEIPGIEDLAESLGLRTVPNPDWSRGMFSSVVEGVREALACRPRCAGFLIFPVDHPRVRGETVAELLESFRVRPAGTWVRPGYEGRGGHPVVVDAASAETLTAMDPGMTLRAALQAAGLAPFTVPVDDPGVLRNVNTPEDLES
jgi:CTP:molybdopterin cytidylyltransferase MocA